MTAHVTFRASDPPNAPTPVPTGRNLPEWFRGLEQSIDAMPIPVDKTARLCMPLNDAMRLGWFLLAPCDIHLRKTGNGVIASAGVEDVIETFEIDQPDRDRNSAFLLPECLLSTGWGIETPSGYATLVTQPMNRDELRFTVPGMVVDTDEYDGRIDVPIYAEREEVTIETGEPIAQVIPVAREDLGMGVAAKSFRDDPIVEEMHRKTAWASDRRKGVYRKESWVPKASSRIVDDPNDLPDPTDAGQSSQPTPDSYGDDRDRRDGNQDANDAKLSYYCFEDQFGSLPAPMPAAECVPEWYDDRLRAVDGLNAEQPTSDWICAATEIGAIIPLAARTTVRRTDGEYPLEVTSDEEAGHDVQHPLKTGDDHPLAPVPIVNISSRWAVNPPSGYSVLVCSPFAHFQRYYRSYAGLADFDRYVTTANAPGLFTDRADERTFPARTPIAQHIPINRERILAVGTIEP